MQGLTEKVLLESRIEEMKTKADNEIKTLHGLLAVVNKDKDSFKEQLDVANKEKDNFMGAAGCCANKG